MIRAGIIGGGGYTAGELIRILVFHPQIELAFVQSESQAGKPIESIHADVIGLDIRFSEKPELEDLDVLFLCSGHGRSQTFLEENPVSADCAVIDLSRDFRLDPEWVYGLPELNRESIRKSRQIANPGCFATAIQLGLLPLAEAGLLQQDVHIHAITGSTGAGQSPQPTTHFSWRQNNVSIYKAFRHQHLDEIRQSLEQLQPGFPSRLNFLPIRGNFPRGIFASLYTVADLSEEQALDLYRSFYALAPFTHVTEVNGSLKQVVNTNNCVIHLEKHEDQLLIISAIDNLLKGASGQAVENMNLIFNFPQDEGLRLKATAF
jgi:N-acetyl-gamma-glutamyl-phosphate reductase